MKKTFSNLLKLIKNFNFKRFFLLLVEANAEEKDLLLAISTSVRADGEVTPESQVHLIMTNLTGPIEDVKIQMGDKIKKDDVLFHIALSTHKENYLTTLSEVDARRKKVNILQDLYDKGAESEIRLLDEKLQLLESEKRLTAAKTNYEYSEVKSSASGTVENSCSN